MLGVKGTTTSFGTLY